MQLIGIFFISTGILVLAVFFAWSRTSRASRGNDEALSPEEIEERTYPLYGYVTQKANRRAEKILAQAMAQARDIVASAEQESLKLVGKSREESSGVEEEFKKSIAALSVEMRERLSNTLDSETAKLFEQGRSFMDAFEQHLQDGIREHFTAEFQDIKRTLAEYRHARKEIMDEHIVELFENAFKIFLLKTLPPKEHADIAYAALEEAKKNTVFPF